MAYGIFSPWGLQAVRTQTDASWNGKTNTYPIQSGYAWNIFNGDPVTIQNGYLVSLAQIFANAYNTAAGTVAQSTEAGMNAVASTPILGVFDGCSYVDAVSANSGMNFFQSPDSASPGRPFWPGGTQVNPSSQGMGSSGAFAYVITDPKVVYNIQVGNSLGGGINAGAVNAATSAFPGNTLAANWSWTTFAGEITQVNGVNMQSSMFADLGAVAAGYLPGYQPALNYLGSLYVDALSSNVLNIENQPFNNVEVMIENHVFGSFSTKMA